MVSESNFQSDLYRCEASSPTLKGRTIETGSFCTVGNYGEYGTANRATVSAYRSPIDYDQSATEADVVANKAIDYTSSSRSRFLSRNCQGLKPGETKQIEATKPTQVPTKQTTSPAPLPQNPPVIQQERSSDYRDKAVEDELRNASAAPPLKPIEVPDISDFSQGFAADVIKVDKHTVTVRRHDDGRIHSYQVCSKDSMQPFTPQASVKLFMKANCVTLTH